MTQTPARTPSHSPRPARVDAASFVPRKVLDAFAGAALLVLAIIIRVKLVPFTNLDFTNYFDKWGNAMRAQGAHFFSSSLANYNPPFLYLYYLGIKLGLSNVAALKSVTMVFEGVLAISVGRAVAEVRGVRWGVAAGLTTLYLPTVMINGPVWGQIDSAYAALCLLAFLSLFRGRRWSPWIWFGLAISFKMQAVFAAPVFVWALLKRPRFSLDMVCGPALSLIIWFTSLIPCWLMGRPMHELLSIYANQADT